MKYGHLQGSVLFEQLSKGMTMDRSNDLFTTILYVLYQLLRFLDTYTLQGEQSTSSTQSHRRPAREENTKERMENLRELEQERRKQANKYAKQVLRSVLGAVAHSITRSIKDSIVRSIKSVLNRISRWLTAIRDRL